MVSKSFLGANKCDLAHVDRNFRLHAALWYHSNRLNDLKPTFYVIKTSFYYTDSKVDQIVELYSL